MTEHDIQNQIRLELSKAGFVVFRANVGDFLTLDGRYMKSTLPVGFSDLFAVKNGRVYFFEVKDAKGKATKEQLKFLQRMQDLGCCAGVVRSVDDVVELVGGA